MYKKILGGLQSRALLQECRGDRRASLCTAAFCRCSAEPARHLCLRPRAVAKQRLAPCMYRLSSVLATPSRCPATSGPVHVQAFERWQCPPHRRSEHSFYMFSSGFIF